MIQDSKGFMWIGTHEGLNRYDGQKFKVFKHSVDDPNSLGIGGVWPYVKINQEFYGLEPGEVD